MEKVSEDNVLLQMLAADVGFLVDTVKAEARAWREAAGPVPIRTVQLRLPIDPLSANPPKDIVVQWTPAGLSVYQNGKRFLCDQPFMVIEVMPSMPRLR